MAAMHHLIPLLKSKVFVITSFMFALLIIFCLLLFAYIFNIISLIDGGISQFYKFEENQTPKAIDYYVSGDYFIVGLGDSIYKLSIDGMILF